MTTGFEGDSFGPLVGAWAKAHMGLELMEWQQIALNGQLCHDAEGDLLAREALVSSARQQGKSVALRALIGWWLCEMPKLRKKPQYILSTANRLDRAESIFRDLAFLLKDMYGAKLGQVPGHKTVTMPDGSRWEIRAASNKLHGGTYDLVVIDELFDVSEAVLDEALRPSMIARRSPLLSCWSTAGDADSTAMIKLREEALGLIDRGETGRLFFAEWSMPPGVDHRDERFWHYPNPALGHTVSIDALRAAANKDYFLRAHLNLWITARGAWVDEQLWGRAKTSDPIPAGGVLSIDSSLDDSRYVGVRAAPTADGRTIVHVEFVTATEDDMWAEVERVMADQKVQLLVSPTLEIHTPELLRRRTNIAGYAELLRYTPTVRSMINEGRLQHTGSTALSEHVCRAVLVKTAQGAVVSSQKSPGPIELCRCMILAAAVASRPATAGRPMLVVA